MKALSKFVSYIFHPLLFPTYGAFFILLTNPNMFGYFGDDRVHGAWLILVFALTFVFPAVWLFMMRRLEMIDSYQLESAKDRIVPFIATATFYLWATWMFKPSPNMKIPPNELIFYMLSGATISIFLGFFVNVFSKISLHSMGAGNFLGLMLPIIRLSTLDLRMVFIGCIVLGGLIGTARLLLKAHEPREVYVGYFAGFTGQFVAFTFVPLLIVHS
ncbi:MAG: hypothetical protein U0V74_00260 [Chitinophagales bacterium]